MTFVNIDLTQVHNWESFHKVFAETMGFPNFYGHNMNAWIDCMSDLSTPDNVGMTAIQIPEGEPLVLVLNESIDFSKRLPQIFSELLECTAFVNQNLDEPESSQLLLLLN
jgi:RNAse (barnase) inhibitor barstar